MTKLRRRNRPRASDLTRIVFLLLLPLLSYLLKYVVLTNIFEALSKCQDESVWFIEFVPIVNLLLFSVKKHYFCIHQLFFLSFTIVTILAQFLLVYLLNLDWSFGILLVRILSKHFRKSIRLSISQKRDIIIWRRFN